MILPYFRLGVVGRYNLACALAPTPPFQRAATKINPLGFSRFIQPLARRTVFISSKDPSNPSLKMAELRGGGTKEVRSWTFDKPCETMEWTPFAGDRVELKQIGDGNELSEMIEDCDVIVIGVLGPVKAEKDEDLDEGNKEVVETEVIELSGQAKALDSKFGGIITQVLKENAKTFKNGAELGSSAPVIRILNKGKIQKIILVGLGSEKNESSDDKGEEKNSQPNLSGLKLGASIVTAIAAEKGTKKALIIMQSKFETNYSDLSSSFYSQLYCDVRFKGLKSNAKVSAEDLTTVGLYLEGESNDVGARLESGASLAKGIYLTKDIVNAPHNVLNSLALANTARRIAKESGGSITCQILGKKEIEARGMGAFMAVARGSETEPQLIHLTYKAKGDIKKKVGLVGKGLLFDTGGHNIKTQMMELMKFDCGGSAAVLGAARAVGELQPEGVEAHFIVAACENMISAKAYVPSDILTASNGKTIEVMNTDAEGRLTLADALVFADKELGCESIVELSTLTGACMVSLGLQVAGVWTANEDLAKELDQCSKETGDKAWRMPLVQEYKEQLKSNFADMKNIGGKYGGAITAALFLTEFVSKKKPFAHIDIAGPVWSDANGATGYGCRLATNWVKMQGVKNDLE